VWASTEDFCPMVHQPNAFIAWALFDLWGDDVFSPVIEERQRDLGYPVKVCCSWMALGPITRNDSPENIVRME
jgi:hypothetical protein